MRYESKVQSAGKQHWQPTITVFVKVGGVGETAAEGCAIVRRMGGGKRRVADFVAVCAAVGLWRAAGFAVVRRIQGSNLPLRAMCSKSATAGDNTGNCRRIFALTSAAAIVAITALTIRENCRLVRGCSPKHSRKSAPNRVVVVNKGTFGESLSTFIQKSFSKISVAENAGQKRNICVYICFDSEGGWLENFLNHAFRKPAFIDIRYFMSIIL